MCRCTRYTSCKGQTGVVYDIWRGEGRENHPPQPPTPPFPYAYILLSSPSLYALTYIYHAAPSGIPELISFSDVNLTSITVQWTELPCSGRNGVITNYTVEYNSTTPPHTNIFDVPGSSNTRLVVGGLLPRTNYTFSVRAQGASDSQNATQFTATPTGWYSACSCLQLMLELCVYAQNLDSFYVGHFTLTTA